MALRVTQLHDRFVGEITGADLSAPPSPDLRDFVQDAMDTHAVCVVRQPPITDGEHIRFARLFGTLELPPGYPDRRSARMAPELFFAGNLDNDGNIKPIVPRAKNIAAGAEQFHADSSFNAQPSKWSMLRGVECPPPEVGGDTLFVDLRAAYDDLEPSMKQRLTGLLGVHDFWEARRRDGMDVNDAARQAMPLASVLHPIVRTMPYGRKTLFVGGHCVDVAGLPSAEGRALLSELYEHATQSEYVYRHRWVTGDIVIWENRCVLHAATPLNTATHRRDMRRATINDDPAEVSVPD